MVNGNFKTMIIHVCAKCGMSLPNNYLTPVIMRNQMGQQKQGFLCMVCKDIIDKQQRRNNENNQTS